MKHITTRIELNRFTKEHNGLGNIPIDILKIIHGDVFTKILNNEERLKLVPTIEKYWRERGFPYQKYTLQEIKNEWEGLCNYDINQLETPGPNGLELTMNVGGLGIVNSFHPHKWAVKCRNFRTPIELYNDIELFPKAILKAMTLFGNPMDDSLMRGILRTYSGTHTASNFRPTVAKYMYNKYCPVGGKVLDISMGYSGRLFGALCSNIGEYQGTDPCVPTFEGGQNCLKTIQKIAGQNKLMSFTGGTKLPKVVMHNIPFEEFKGESDYFDLIFTSPPYFNIEQYSHEENQSWKKYSEYDSWVNNFLKPMCQISHRVLKKGGTFAINIYGKVGKGRKNDLAVDFNRCAEESFGKIDHTIYMQLGKIIGTKKDGQGINDRIDHKLEPIYIYKKT